MRDSTRKVLCGAIAVALSPLAHAQSAAVIPAEDGIRWLGRVVVVASKAAEPAAQVVGTVSSLDRETIERRQVQTIADLVRYEPGVDALGDVSRFGWQGFSVRGLDGNRVGMEIDGVPLAEGFSVGQFAAAGRDLVDIAAVQRVEILRGPASTLYGSDALAGVVAWRTLDPQDLLDRVEGQAYLGGRLGWTGRDRGRQLSVSMAGGSGALQGMLLLSHREGHEVENASTRMPANPVDQWRRSALAKLAWDGGVLGRWTFALDAARGRSEVDMRSSRFGPGRLATTTELLGDDRFERDRASLKGEWTPDAAWLDASELLVYGQRNRSLQDTAQTRLADRATPFPSLRERRFDLRQRNTGLKWLGQARSEAGAWSHWHVFGLEYARTRYSGYRDGREINLATGASSNVVLGERFPVRDFPESRSTELGAFWQDEIGIGETFAVIPGLRWERYRLDAEADAMFREDYPDVAVADIARSAWTPKLGLRWRSSGHSTWFAQYARGFRAPPFGDVNIGLSLTLLNYEVRPNPQLRPERSQGLELGWRWEGPRLQAQLSAYRNRYRYLIESRANLGIDPVTRALVFQSVNRTRASIHGVEASLSYSPGASSDWALRAAAAWAHGRDQERNQPLNSVAPAKLVLGASWEPLEGRWGAELVATGVARQGRLDTSAGPLFRAPGHALLDAYAWWRFRPGMRLGLGLQNIADRRYWDWTSVRGIDPLATTPPLDFHTRPGRNVSVTLGIDW